MIDHRHESIAKVAYALWEYAGCPQGRDTEFWTVADSLIPNPMPWGWDSKDVTDKAASRHQRHICNCGICQYSRKVQAIMETGDVDQMRAVIDELMNSAYNMGFEMEMNNVIMNGSWPSAVEQLEAALEIARKHPNRLAKEAEEARWKKLTKDRDAASEAVTNPTAAV